MKGEESLKGIDWFVMLFCGWMKWSKIFENICATLDHLKMFTKCWKIDVSNILKRHHHASTLNQVSGWVSHKHTIIKTCKYQGCNKTFYCFMALFKYLFEGYSLDRIKMTEWIWPKLVNMTEKLTTMNVNMVNLTIFDQVQSSIFDVVVLL